MHRIIRLLRAQRSVSLPDVQPLLQHPLDRMERLGDERAPTFPAEGIALLARHVEPVLLFAALGVTQTCSNATVPTSADVDASFDGFESAVRKAGALDGGGRVREDVLVAVSMS